MPVEIQLKNEQSDGTPVFASTPLEGSRKNFYTHDWADKTTWVQGSERVTGETLTDSGDHKTYNPATARAWIDVVHGKLFGEAEMVEAHGVVITVDDVAQTENSPGETDGDFTVNYTTGAVTFNDALTGTEVVKATYSYAASSVWAFEATYGKKLRVTEVKVLFSKDLEMTDNLIFQVWGYDPEDPPNKIPYSGAEVYKRIDNFLQDANHVQPMIAKIGGSNWRAMSDDLLPMSFDYTASIDLYGSYGMEIRVWLENDVPFSGSTAYGTFYCLSADE